MSNTILMLIQNWDGHQPQQGKINSLWAGDLFLLSNIILLLSKNLVGHQPQQGKLNGDLFLLSNTIVLLAKIELGTSHNKANLCTLGWWPVSAKQYYFVATQKNELGTSQTKSNLGWWPASAIAILYCYLKAKTEPCKRSIHRFRKHWFLCLR